MSEFDRLIEAGLEEFETLAGETITIQGVDYPCVFSSVAVSRSVQDAGIMEGMDASAILRKSSHPTRPQIGHLATVNGLTFMIEVIADDRGNWNLGLIDKNR